MKLGLFVAALACALSLPPPVAAPSAPARTFSPQEVQADFVELYERLKASHFDLYARQPKRDYDAMFEEMRAGFVRPMSRFEVETTFQRFVAYGNVAHARIEFPSEAFGAFRDAGGKILPLTVRVLRDRAYVNENNSGLSQIAVGDEITALDKQPMTAWLIRLGANVSADNPHMTGTFIENRLPALLWLEVGERATFDLQLRRANGALTEIAVPARTRGEINAAIQRRPKALPWDAREARMLPNGVAYLRPGPFFHTDPNATNMWDTRPFADFIDRSFRSFIAAGARTLLIDLRDNPGGDNSFSDLMVAWYATKPFQFASAFRIKVSQAAIDSNQKRVAQMPGDTASISHQLAAAYKGRRMGEVISFPIPTAAPRTGERFTGKVYLLINRHSYSNTVLVAALSQDYGFAKILGEETADLATTYGAMEQFTLSRTGTAVGFPKALIVRANGSMAARGVVPDIAIETPLVEGSDAIVLARAVEIAARR